MRARLLALALCAAACGAGLALVVRSASSPPRGRRPDAVEAALRALDAYERRGDAAGLAAAAQAVGAPEGHPAPYDEEARLVRVVADGDAAALWRFAEEGPPGPARARALRFLALRGATEAERVRARERLARDYPSSWALGPGTVR